MPRDLHQPWPARRPLLARRPLFSSMALALCLAAIGVRAQDRRAPEPAADAAQPDAPRAPAPCAIDGRAAIPGLEITRRSRHGHTTVARIDVPVREIRLEVLAPALFHVWTREGEPALEGHTHRHPPMSLRSELTLGGVTARRGAPVARLTPREQSLDIDVDLGASVTLRRVFARCETLRIRESDEPVSPPTTSLHPPLWRARGRELSLRASPEEGLELARLAIPAALAFEERGRTDGFVRIRAELPHGSLDGWVRDTMLVPHE
ncbi:MAG: hypothetical protein K1X94_04540 [Sandaracinaceae bacterium]|jgi:hypothetical protein|nr:hypothetical protein [Sandaracinaceae bacterium]